MLAVRPAKQRYDDRRGKQSNWLTFYNQAAADPLSEGFGGLRLLNEIRLPPGGSMRAHPPREAEVVTYLLEGTLAYEDSLGRTGLMQAGEFRCMTVGRGISSTETNLSRTNWTHLFRIGLGSSEEYRAAQQQKRFSAAERRGGLCLVASADARAGSLPLHQDARVYSALLRAGQHLIHELAEGRRAWLHVVSGELMLQDLVLTSGDGVGITGERSVSFTAVAESEVLLFDVV